MDSRTIAAFGLMILIYFVFFQPTQPPPAVPTTTTEQGTSEATKSAEVDLAPRVVTQGGNAESQLGNQILSLENDQVRMQIDLLGRIRDVHFKNYFQTPKEDTPVSFQFKERPFNSSRLRLQEGGVNWKLVEKSDRKFVLQSNDSSGLLVQRTVELPESGFYIVLKDEVTNNGPRSIRVGASTEIFHPASAEVAPAGFWKAIFQPQAEIQQFVGSVGGSLERKLLADIKTPLRFTENPLWSGFSYKYFFMGTIAQDVSVSDLRVTRQENGVVQDIEFNEKQVAPGESTAFTQSFFIGPKDIPQLVSLSPDLGKVVEYGDWLGPISRFLLGILHFFYGIIPNYGIAIILLTILVKVALFPLVFKSSVSMRRFMLIAPKMKELRDKYKNDKHRLNAELMTLYKTEKVNPVGGCLPLLLQMPVFFALYRVFFVSLELRHAPFFGWIQDLSAHDPYFVTPILMTALMWLQQRITPMPPAAEENEAVQIQRAMLKWMPIFFGFIMLFLPSGLNLYMLTNAAVSVVQQLWLNKYLNQRFPMAPVAVSAKGVG
jgi:YidC/Oxa1 family membrane protein insertase